MKPPAFEASSPRSDLLQALLREVSRSFYQTLRILPAAVRRPVGLGYLLARATDTIADTELVPVAVRLEALEALSQRIDGRRPTPLDFRSWGVPDSGTVTAAGSSPPAPHSLAVSVESVGKVGSAAEMRLLVRIEEAIQVLQELTPADREEVRDVLRTITSGQILDLRRFGSASSEQIVALANAAELDDYTFRVAGCVGGFWTRLCRRLLFPRARVDEAALLADGLRFGQGLQLVNILRDLPRDLRQGRCYLPADELARIDLQPSDLLDVANEPRFRVVFHWWLDQAESNLTAGWRYTNSLPFSQWRLRLGCAWPVLIGVETIHRLRVANILDAAQRVKISRREVRQIAMRTLLRLPFRRAWERLGPTETK